MEKELNIKVAKDIIYIEIKKYRLKKESIKEIESKISMLKDVMFIISQDLDILNLHHIQTKKPFNCIKG